MYLYCTSVSWKIDFCFSYHLGSSRLMLTKVSHFGGYFLGTNAHWIRTIFLFFGRF